MNNKPESWDDEMREYLESLRDSGEVNMFGAAPYLARDFNLTRKQATECLMYWMHSYE